MKSVAHRWQTLAEIALVFAVFFVEGAWPAPELNEPNYLGKAIHFWNPGWASHDFFLQTADTHWVFYFSFGWLSLWLRPTALAWTGRLLTWGLLAWAWRRLSFAVVPRRWLAPVTAAFVAAMIQHGNLAGEWMIGGVEAKGFAYVFVLLGLEGLVLGRWNRAWLLLGAASAFHVLVGGWAAVAAGLAWLFLKTERERGASESRPLSRRERARVRAANTAVEDSASSPASPHPRAPRQWSLPEGEGDLSPSLRSMWPGLLGGLLLALPGLVPPLVLNWGTDAATTRAASEIYVYQRLPHHLDPWRFPLEQLVPFAVLCLVWLALGRVAPRDPPPRRLRAFVVASLTIALAGMALSLVGFWDQTTAAGLLRFYWFRLADVALPIGIALLGARWIAGWRQVRPALGRCLLTGAVAIAGLHVADCVVLRLISVPPYGDRFWDLDAWASAGRWLAHPVRTPLPPRQPRADRLGEYAAWREACAWVAAPGHVPPGAIFLTPRMSQTFKWYAQRSEAGTWKEVPQDARGIVEWWQRMNEFYGSGSVIPAEHWCDSLDQLSPKRFRELQEVAVKEHIDYLLTTVSDPLLRLPKVYQNNAYVIYQLLPAPSAAPRRPPGDGASKKASTP